MRRHSLPENKKMTMGLFRRLAREAKPIWPAILFSCLLNLVIIACSILTPELTGQVTDKIMGYFETGAPANLLAEIRPSLLLLLGAYVIFGLTRLFNMYCMNNVVSRHFTCAIRIKMSDKIQRLPVKFVDGTPVGQILERMTDDVSAMGNSVHNVVDTFIGGILQIIAISVALLLEDWRLGLIVLAAIPVSVVLSAQLSQRSRKYHRATFREAAQAYSITEEAYTNFATTKAYNLEASLIEKHKEITDTQAEYREKAAFIGGLVRPVITFANNLTFILVNLLGGWLAIQGKIPLSAVVTVVLFARQFATPLERIANGFTMLQRTAAASERVFHMLDLPEEDPRAGAVEPQAVQGEVVFDRVKFAYDPDRPLIDNLSFTATPGQTVAIVGPTGAGKTTIVNLLMSFYDILEGEIRIDGRPFPRCPGTKPGSCSPWCCRRPGSSGEP